MVHFQSASKNRATLAPISENRDRKIIWQSMLCGNADVNSLWWAKGIHPVAGLLRPVLVGHPEGLP